MGKIPDGTVRTSLTLDEAPWSKFQRSTAVLGLTDRAGAEEAMRLWLDEHAGRIAVAHRRAAEEAESVPDRKRGDGSSIA